MDETYTPTIDHSQDFTIHTSKDGTVFGIRNIQINAIDGKISAEISGDHKAAMEYLEDCLSKIFKKMTCLREL